MRFLGTLFKRSIFIYRKFLHESYKFGRAILASVSIANTFLIENYWLIRIKCHDDFSESYLQVIKIYKNYYLYFYSYIGEPLSYFH